MAPDAGGLLVIASDGLWDVAEAETVAALAHRVDRWVFQPPCASLGMGSSAGQARARLRCSQKAGCAPS